MWCYCVTDIFSLRCNNGVSMAKTSAERQREYRANRPEAGDNGERRLNTWVSTGTALALDRLANRYHITKREMLERLIRNADDKVLKILSGTKEFEEYLGGF